MWNTIKQKAKSTWNWVKKTVNGAKRWIIALVVGGIVLAAVIPGPPPIPSLMINGKLVEFFYTDDNTNEDLIIHTTQEYYSSFAGNFNVFYTIKNTSGQGQWIKTVFSFSDSVGHKKYMTNISEYDGEDTIYYQKTIGFGPPSTSTDLTSITTTTSKQVTKWKKTPLQTFAVQAISNRKEVKGMTGLRNGLVHLNAGEEKFFKVNIKYLLDTSKKEEFFIEVFGDKQGYGHLDPWVFEENFNECLIEDLDTNAGCPNWSGHVNFDVQTGTVYSDGGSTQAVSHTSGDNWQVIEYDITDIESGNMYVVMRASANNVDGPKFYLWLTGGFVAYIEFRSTGSIDIRADPGAWVSIGVYSANQWYPLNIEFNTTQYRARMYDGSWGSFTAWTNHNGGTVLKILFYSGVSNGYWDCISATDPTEGVSCAAAVAVEVKDPGPMWFD